MQFPTGQRVRRASNPDGEALRITLVMGSEAFRTNSGPLGPGVGETVIAPESCITNQRIIARQPDSTNSR
jgi:hypothetical protein